MEQILLSGVNQVMRKTIGPALSKAIHTGKGYAVNVSPEDTGDYASSFQVVEPTQQGASVVGQLNNTDDKATGVEWGWRKSPVRWSKQGGSPTVAFGVGARVYQKTNIEIQKTFINNVKRGSV